MKEKSQERRKHYFIKKKFQFLFILKFCTLVVIGAFVSIAIIYAVSRGTVTTSFENSRLVIKSTADFILPAALLSSAVVILGIGLATIFVTLYSSHKIAGPLYRLEKDMEDIASGNLKKTLHLRYSDEIQALAENLNTMTQNLKTSIAEVKTSYSELENLLRSKGIPLDEELKSKMDKIKSALDKFQT